MLEDVGDVEVAGVDGVAINTGDREHDEAEADKGSSGASKGMAMSGGVEKPLPVCVSSMIFPITCCSRELMYALTLFPVLNVRQS